MQTLFNRRAATRLSLLVTAAFSLSMTACGGGGGSTNSPPPPPPPPPPSNSAPVFTGATDFTFQENQVVQFALTVSDADGDTITISDDNTGDGAFFIVDVTTGNVSANTPTSDFDFENPQDVDGNNVYEQSITLSDGQASTTTVITVTITDVNEPPVCGPAIVTHFDENFVGVLYDFTDASSDPEGTTPTGFVLDGLGRTTNVTQESLDKFMLDTTTGELSLSEGLDAEFEGVEGEYIVTVSTSYGAEVVQCQQNFQIVDIPGVVKSGVKITGKQERPTAIGDVDGDGLTDFYLGQSIFDDNTDLQQPEGYVIFGKTISDELAIDGAETLSIDTLDITQAVKIVGTYSDPDAEFDGNTFGAAPIADLNGDGMDELIVILEPYEDFASESGFVAGRPLGYLVWGSTLSGQTDGEIDMTALAVSEAVSIFGEGSINLNRQNVQAVSGDFTADGSQDIAFVLPSHEDGRVYLVTGATLAANTSGTYDFDDRATGESAIISNEFTSTFDLGIDAGNLGDVDADNGDELVLTNNDRAFVIKSAALINAVAATGAVNFENIPSAQVAVFNTFAPTNVGTKSGDVDNDGIDDLLLGFYGTDNTIGALVYGATIVGATSANPIDLTTTNAVDDFVLFSNSAVLDNVSMAASLLGDIDSDNRDDLAIRFSPATGDGGLYVFLAPELDSIGADNVFDLNTLGAGEGVRIFDGTDPGFFRGYTVLADTDNDDIPDLYIEADDEGYMVPGSDILDFLNDNTAAFDLQTNFNDESGN